MTQEKMDPVEAEQAALDAKQAGQEAAPVYATLEQVRQLLEEQRRSLVREVGGVASKIDKGLNAIRRDTTRLTQEEIQKLVREQRQRAILEEVPEEHRTWAAKVLESTAKSEPVGSEASVKSEPQPEAPEESSGGDEWQQVFRVVKLHRVDPADPAMKPHYGLLTDSAIPDIDERWQRFLEKVVEVRDSKKLFAGQEAGKAPSPKQPRSVQPNPPVESTPAAALGFRNVDDVWDAIIKGTIPVETEEGKAKARAALARFGVTNPNF